MKQTVKYFAAILTSKTDLLDEIIERLSKKFGAFDYKSGWFDFFYTNFYEPEMGKDLKRCIVSFQKTIPPEDLPKAKKWSQEVEDKFRIDGKREVNIDAGYMDACKVVLISGKFGGHKIDLTKDCYADMIMDYQKGNFIPMPWCFTDFASGVYNKTLLEIRNILKSSTK